MSEWRAMDLGEDNMDLFSKIHLKYSFAKAFRQWECNGMEGEVPIVWFTRPSSLKVSIGSFCICSISPNRIRGIVPPTHGIRHDLLETRCEVTKDVFWQKVNSASGIGFGISQLILYRLLAHFVYMHYNAAQKISPSKNTLVDHMENIQLGDYNLELLFSPKLSAVEYMNNHVCKITKRNLDFFNHLSRNGYVGQRQSNILALTNLAFRGVSPQALRQVLVERTTNDHRPPDDQVEFPFYDSGTPQVILLNTLATQPGFSTLYRAIRHACSHGILTESLLIKLLEFRLQFNRNRETFQQGALGIPNYTEEELNTKLMEEAGYSGCQCTMHLKSVRGPG
jgi:hypothetical protein